MTAIEIKHPTDKQRLRRLALSAQGLLAAQPFGRGLAGAREAIEHIGYVQIDSISVIERAHHHVLQSRVPNYQPELLNKLLLAGDVFEYWSHAAAFLPMADFRFSLPYKAAIKSGQVHWYKNPDQKLMAELLARIRADGPLRSRDLENRQSKKGAGWWDWKPAKKALEQLYMQGDLMVSNRQGFEKTYDLTERVLPSGTDTRTPSTEEFAWHLLDQQLRCQGLVSLKGLIYLRKIKGLRQAMTALLAEQVSQGRLQELKLSNGDVFLLPKGKFEKPLPRVSKRLKILSPFDNAVIQRQRLAALFDFDYQIECYVPAAKRQYGYFCLPLLFGDEFIGRMDCKAHRSENRLEIIALHLEKQSYDEDELIAALAEALKPFRQFQRCDSISVSRVSPNHLTQGLQQAL